MTRLQAEKFNLGMAICLAVGALLMIEFAMWTALDYRLHSTAFVTAFVTAHQLAPAGQRRVVFTFASAMILLISPLMLAWMQATSAGRKMKLASEDEFAILKAKREIYWSAGISYFACATCVLALMH